MTSFDPSKTQFVDCELVYQTFESHPMSRSADQAKRSSYELSQHVLPIAERRFFIIWIKIEGEVLNDQDHRVAASIHVFRSLFIVENFDDLITADKENNTRNIDTDAIAAFLSISVSTVRGQLQALMATTHFRHLPLPILSIQEVLTLPDFDIEKFIPSWIAPEPDALEAGPANLATRLLSE